MEGRQKTLTGREQKKRRCEPIGHHNRIRHLTELGKRLDKRMTAYNNPPRGEGEHHRCAWSQAQRSVETGHAGHLARDTRKKRTCESVSVVVFQLKLPDQSQTRATTSSKNGDRCKHTTQAEQHGHSNVGAGTGEAIDPCQATPGSTQPTAETWTKMMMMDCGRT